MNRQKVNPLLIVLTCALVISLGLSCSSTPTPDNGSDCECYSCLGQSLASNFSLRLEDLPPGWLLYNMQTGPTCEYPFRIQDEAWASLSFWDDKPWNDPKRRVSNELYLRWDEIGASYYFQQWLSWSTGWEEIEIPRAEAAFVKVVYEGVNSTATGALVLLKSGLYHVSMSSFNRDLMDLGIVEGPEVDAEVAFVTDLANKVASRIP